MLCLVAASAPAAAQPRPPIRLVLEHTIDDRVGLSLGRIERIALGPDGSVAAVDGANGVVYRFTPAGKLRDSLGRKGQGPGEFQVAAGLGVGPAGEIALADLRNRRLTFWEPDGRLRGSTQLGAMPVDLLWSEGDPIVGVVVFAVTPVAPLIRFAPIRLDKAEPGPELAAFPDPATADYPTAVSCGTCRHALSAAGRLVVAAPDTFYRVSELDAAGKPLRSWRRGDIGAGLRTPEEFATLKSRLQAGPGGGRPPPGAEARFRAPGDDALRFRNRFQGLGVDATGRLLALVSNAGSTRPVIDVFGPDGRFQGTIVLQAQFQAMVVRGSREAALGETADGTPAILVYRIEELPR